MVPYLRGGSLGSGRPGSDLERSWTGGRAAISRTEAIDVRIEQERTALEAVLARGEGGAGGGAGVLARSARLLSGEKDRYLTAATRDGKKRLRTYGDLTVTGLRRAGRPGSTPAGREAGRRGRVLDPAGREELRPPRPGSNATTLTRAGRSSCGRARAHPRGHQQRVPQRRPQPRGRPDTVCGAGHRSCASEALPNAPFIEPAGAKTSACQRRRHDVTAERANRGRRRHGPAWYHVQLEDTSADVVFPRLSLRGYSFWSYVFVSSTAVQVGWIVAGCNATTSDVKGSSAKSVTVWVLSGTALRTSASGAV